MCKTMYVYISMVRGAKEENKMYKERQYNKCTTYTFMNISLCNSVFCLMNTRKSLRKNAYIVKKLSLCSHYLRLHII